MSRRAQVCAWGLVALAIGFLVLAGAVDLSTGHSFTEAISDVTGVGIVFSICFPVLGAFVIRQRGGHRVGWLLIGIGVSIALNTATNRWANATLIDEPGSLPGGDVASWLQAWTWMPGWVLATTLLPVVFPDGRPAGRHRVLAWVDAIGVTVTVVAIAIASWHIRGRILLIEDRDLTPHQKAAEATLVHISSVTFVAIGVLTVASMASLLIRFQRASGTTRRQIAWVVYGAAVAVVMSIIGVFLDVGGLFNTLEASALVAGLAVAMFRYRLYDIDVVINRTLVYGALTATLAGIYIGSVLLLQLLLSGLTKNSGLAVAVSTLAVAALFRPARAGIQGTVDRRFYRRKYDAARTLERFGTRLRDEVDLDALGSELRAVVADTMQPASVSLWLRVPEMR
jgi:hypothetical protein